MNEKFQSEVDAVVARYQPELDRIEKEGKELGDEAADPNAFEAMIDVDFTVEWKDTKLSATIPTVTMRTKKISIDVPSVTMKTRKVSFDVPEIRMETYCAFKRPVVRRLSVRMECAYLDKPVMKMVTKEIKTDIPEVRMKTQNFSVDIPEFGTRLLEIVITLPQFTVTSVSGNIKTLEEKGNSLQERGEAVAKKMETEIQSLVTKFFGDGADDGTSIRQQIESQFDEALSSVTNSINALKSEDIDPSKVPAKSGNINLRKTMKELHTSKEEALDKIDDELETA